jgi:hypothetical protein
MAPLSDTVVDELKNTVHKLEKRIAELEGRLSGHGGGPSTAQESVRMILMGPPGAGETALRWRIWSDLLTQWQERAHRHLESRKSSAHAISYVVPSRTPLLGTV